MKDRPIRNTAARRAVRRLMLATERLLAEAAKVKAAYDALLRLNTPKESPK